MAEKLDIMKIGTFGAVAGVLTVFLMTYLISPVLNFLGQYTPEISAKLASGAPVISIHIRESLTGINAGLSGWMADALGLTIPSTVWMPYVMAAAGGAALFIVGAWLTNLVGWLKGDAVAKTRVVIFVGSAAAAFIIGGFAVPELGITLVNSLIAFGINAAILAWVYVTLAKALSKELIPF